MAVVAACGSESDTGARSPAPTTVDSAPVDSLPVIVDTDVSLDDVMAILYLLRRPDVDVLAVTVNGNGVAHCEAGVSIVLGLLAVAQQQSTPVACGAERPLEGDNSFPGPWRDARDSMAAAGILPPGGAPAPNSAATVIVDAVAGSPRPPTVVLLGTHTNLAQALRDRPGLADDLGAIHIMGGAVDVPGNTIDNPAAEWNLWIDPVATSEVLATDVPLSIVPLDATAFVPLTEEFAAALAGNLATPESEAADALLRTDPAATTSGLFMWDQLAVVALVEPTLVTWEELLVDVDASTDPDVGGTLTAGSGRPARVAVAADRSAFESEFLSTLTGRDVPPLGGATVSAARSGYIAEADRICAAADADADVVFEAVFDGVAPDAAPTAEILDRLWSGLEPILRAQVSSLRGLVPPPEDADEVASLFDDFDAVLDEVSATIDAALAGDSAALAQLTGQGSDANPFDDVNRRAREFGFRICGAEE